MTALDVTALAACITAAAGLIAVGTWIFNSLKKWKKYRDKKLFNEIWPVVAVGCAATLALIAWSKRNE